MLELSQKPYLNLGCGRIILPAPRPDHHALVDEAIYSYPMWTNADRNAEPGVDCVVDLFRYPWPWDDNSFDGALLSHLVEHIPHEIRTTRIDIWLEHKSPEFWEARRQQLECMQDGWYAFMSELYRVLTPGAIAHILCPYGWSQAGITDPTHTRLVTEHTFTHSMQPDPNSPFKYETGGINFEMVEAPRFGLYHTYMHLVLHPDDNEAVREHKRSMFEGALATSINVVNDLYVKLRANK